MSEALRDWMKKTPSWRLACRAFARDRGVVAVFRSRRPQRCHTVLQSSVGVSRRRFKSNRWVLDEQWTTPSMVKPDSHRIPAWKIAAGTWPRLNVRTAPDERQSTASSTPRPAIRQRLPKTLQVTSAHRRQHHLQRLLSFSRWTSKISSAKDYHHTPRKTGARRCPPKKSPRRNAKPRCGESCTYREGDAMHVVLIVLQDPRGHERRHLVAAAPWSHR